MGVVYEAEDTVLARTVAVKTIELVFAPGEEARKQFEDRFFTEARVAARLAHPGIVVCHDVGKDPASGKLFIVFEYLKGQTLAARAAEGIGWRDALAIVVQVARAIHHAHEHGVVHRDLKPANIMLLDGRRGPASPRRGEGAVKIMDFGVARLESLGPRLTGPGQSFGSPLYSSPEQVLGENCSARSDIFSVGSVLCTLLLGRPWFDAPSIPEIVARVVHAGPPRVSSLRRDLPAALDAVVAAALAKRQDDRYATAAEMADDLDDVLAGGSPRHAGAMGRSARPVRALTEDALLEGLTVPLGGHGRSAAADGSGPLTALLDEATLSLPKPQATTAPPPSSAPARRRLAPAAAIIAVALLGAGAVFWWWPRSTPLPQPSGPMPSAEAPSPSLLPAPRAISPSVFLGPNAGAVARATPPPSPVPVATDEPTDRPVARAAPLTSAPAPAPSPSAVPEAAGAAPVTVPDATPRTRIRFAVEHPFENGRLIVWIDGVLAFEAKLRAPVARKIVGIKVRDGRLEQLVDVGPGPHEVRVEVAWDQERRVATKVADTAAGSTGLLEVRVGRISKDLSLQWSRLAKD